MATGEDDAKGTSMDRERFERLLEAYGADFRRWPAPERAPAAAFAARHGVELAASLAQARALDEALNHVREPHLEWEALAARILSVAPKPSLFNARAMVALAACAAFGVALGYGGGLLAPTSDEDAGYFALAFASPEDEG